jgi:hypothetical protein
MEKQQYVTFIIICVDVAINNIKVFSVAKEMKQRVPLALVASCRIFRGAVNINNCLAL